MKTKSILTLATVLLCSAGFAFAQAADTDTRRCGQPRGTCGNECDGSGFMKEGQGQAKGQGQGLRRGKRDGTGNGQRRRDGSGPGCNQGT